MTTVLTWAGLAVGLIALVEAIVLYLMQRRTKQLDYQIVANRELVFPGPYGEVGDLEIAYKGHPVKAPRLLALKLINSGKVEIRRDDFDHPLSITIPKDSSLLSSEVSNVSSDVAKPALRAYGDKVNIEPLLLNSGDWIELQLLVDGSCQPRITGRIAGVHKIGDYAARLRSRRKRQRYFAQLGLASLVLGMIVIGIIAINRINSPINTYRQGPLSYELPIYSKCPPNSASAAHQFGGKATYWKKTAPGTWEYGAGSSVIPKMIPGTSANISVPDGVLAYLWDGQSSRVLTGPTIVRHVYQASIHCEA